METYCKAIDYMRLKTTIEVILPSIRFFLRLGSSRVPLIANCLGVRLISDRNYTRRKRAH